MAKKNIYCRDGCLLIVGIMLLIPASIGFLFSSTSNQYNYKIHYEDKDGIPHSQYIQSDKTLEKLQKENPGKTVIAQKPTFPLKSTVVFLIALALLFYSRMVKKKEKKIIQLWDLLEKNKKMKAKTLINKFGFDMSFIHDALYYINQNHTASFTYHADTDLIYDDSDTIEWHLAKRCEGCGAAINERVFITFNTETFTCPYCSCEVIDPKFVEYKKQKHELETEKIKKGHQFVEKFLGIPAPVLEDDGLNRIDGVDISWSPKSRGGSNFPTKKMVNVSPSRIEFKPSIIQKLICLVIFGVGIGVLVSAFTQGYEDEKFILLLFLGTIALIASIIVTRISFIPIVFDKRAGFFWKNRKSPESIVNKNDRANLKNCAPLEEILAIQILEELVISKSSDNGRRSRFLSYEINLVLKDASRININDHSWHGTIEKEAQELADFLEVPLLQRDS